MHVLMIDNFDSFTFNLVDDLEKLDVEVSVVRNDISLAKIQAFITRKKITHVVLSPGPGTPEQAGVCIPLIQALKGVMPVLGVCLGHQAIVVAYGGEVGPSGELFHGKSSKVYYENSMLIKGPPGQFTVGRYHSLAAIKVTESLKVTATVIDKNMTVPMMVEDQNNGIFGVQFHPESILTPQGTLILENFIACELHNNC